MPVWIQLSRVPLELFTRKGISYVVSALGKPLYMDGITTSEQRLAFAKGWQWSGAGANATKPTTAPQPACSVPLWI
ncbi:hypothetical protein Goshw_016372 [Gossypium schwendimanii]|uniref:DUF4283 domain-containing protein n=1 Tax=Gossypium schwendimanii TaxID=34291 RepID=A0A7J9KSR9_GOSSC|nr:hypothetical protein [Gossypium schwendimanii]